MSRTILLFLLVISHVCCYSQGPEIGIIQEPESDSLLYASGYRHFVASVGNNLSPRNLNNDAFQKKLQLLLHLRTNLYACNIFIPPELKVVGPNVDEGAVLAYTEQVFQRAQSAGLKMIVWGSGGSRRVPEGFDREKAEGQFISIAGKVAANAERHGILIVLENINSTETNFITKAEEALAIVKKVNHPNFRLCVDIYHMLMENEPPAVIEKGANLIVYCEIAEKENRAAPGTARTDFRPYLRALKKINYSGLINMECRWVDLPRELISGKKFLQAQIDEVFSR